MQLIAMAMPKGDKGKQKNRNRYQPRSSDDPTDNQSTLVKQSRDDRLVYDTGNVHESNDISLSVSTDIQNQNVSNVNIYPVERDITLYVNRPEPLGNSSDSPSLVRSIQQCIEGVVSETSSCQQQDGVSENVRSESIRDGANIEETHEDAKWRIASDDFKREVTIEDAKRENVYTDTERGIRIDTTNIEITTEDDSEVNSEGDKKNGAGKNDDCSIVENLDEEISYVNSSVVSHIDNLSTTHEFTQSGREQVDENMNATRTHQEHRQQQSSVNVSTTLPAADLPIILEDSRGIIAWSKIYTEGVGESCTSCHDFSSIRQLLISSSQICRQSETEADGTHYDFLPQESVLEESIDFANSNDTLFNDEYLEFHSQTNRPSSRLLNRLNMLSVVEPPLWTSLALRENTINRPEITRVRPQSSLRQLDAGNNSYQWCTFSPVPNEGSERATVTETLQINDTLGEYDIPDKYVFQICGTNNTGTVFNQFLNGYDNAENGYHENNERFIRGNNNGSVSLGDLEYINRILPSTHIDRDVVLNQLLDEEVTMLTYHNEDDDEELVSFDVIEDSFDDTRPINPLADILEHGGNEHFLPITCDVGKEIRDSDEDL